MKKLLSAIILLACTWLGCPEQSVETSFRRGLDLEFRGRYEDAETHFLSLVRELSESDSPGDVSWRVKAILAAARIENLYLNDPRKAVARLREALRDANDEEQAFIGQREIATIFLDRLGDCRSAAPEIERLVVAFPDREGIDLWRYRLAQCYFTLEQFEQARAEARLLLEKNPNSSLAMETRLLVANSYFVEKKYSEALDAHQQILNSSPQPQQQARSLFEEGLCYEQIGDLEKAEQALLGALQSHPRPDVVKGKLTAIRKRMLEMPRIGDDSQGKTHAPQKQTPSPPPAEKPTVVQPAAAKPEIRKAGGVKQPEQPEKVAPKDSSSETGTTSVNPEKVVPEKSIPEKSVPEKTSPAEKITPEASIPADSTAERKPASANNHADKKENLPEPKDGSAGP